MALKVQLAEEIKELQRNHPDGKGAWGRYCDERLGGARDPNRHDAQTLQTFLTLYHQGGLDPAQGRSVSGQWWLADVPPPPKPVPVQTPVSSLLVERIKTLQRTDDKAKQAWWRYCDMHLSGKKDPNLHDESTLQNFLTSYNMGFLNGEPDLTISEEGDSQADLVRKIKYLQRTDTAAKQAWWSYCETHLNGKRDPSVHDAWQLQDFLQSYTTGNFSEETSTVSTSGASLDELVQRIKSLQRTDEDAKLAWQRFCGGVRDPSRHPIPFLERFLASLDQDTPRPFVVPPPPPQPPLPPSSDNQRQWTASSYQDEQQQEEEDAVADPERQQQCESFVRLGTELSSSFSQAWHECCQHYGASLHDPAKYQALVADFTDYASKCLVADIKRRGAGEERSGGSRKRAAEMPPMGEPPAARARQGPKTVAIKKSVTDEVRRLNGLKGLRADIKLGRVAGSLARVDEYSALGVLKCLADNAYVEDPNEFIISQVMMLLDDIGSS